MGGVRTLVILFLLAAQQQIEAISIDDSKDFGCSGRRVRGDAMPSDNGEQKVMASVLHEAAIEARPKGQRLVLVGSDYKFIKEIMGFEPMKPGSMQRERAAGCHGRAGRR
jgi:hypothetical protein